MLQKTIIVFLLTALAHAQEKPETAWTEDNGLLMTGPYVYGSLSVPPGLFRRLSVDNTDPDADPFGEDDTRTLTDINKLAPVIPAKQLPGCLPAMQSYRDLSNILRQNGVNIKDKEWALVSEEPNGDNHLYYCTTAENADVIHVIFNHGCGGPPACHPGFHRKPKTPKQGVDI